MPVSVAICDIVTDRSPWRATSRGGVQDRVAHLVAVRLDRLGPQLRHRPSIRDDDQVT